MPALRDPRGVRGRSGGLNAVAPGLPALARDKGNFFTRSAGEGSVYGEVERTEAAGARWRRWDPHRSKLAAALEAGGVSPPFAELLGSAPVLYLGAASGTTVSHLADLAFPRPVFAVELASRSFQELIVKLKPWTNVFPVLGDARQPQTYAGLVGKAAAIVQDVAQPDQVEILEANCRALGAKGAPALLFMKARSVDSGADPQAIFEGAARELVERGFELREERRLEPYDLDHRAFLLRWKG